MTTLRILVVDDEQGMRSGVRRALRGFTVQVSEMDEQVRFDVEEAASGEEAMEILAASAADIMLLDHKLPGISGIEVLDRVASQYADVLPIMITAYATLETAVHATKQGAYDFLAKPFTPDELKSAVRKAATHVILQRHARQLAQERRQVRFQFISVLAHELKAPLAAIEGYLQILKDRSAGNDQTVYDHIIDRSLIRSEAMRKMIIDLLDMTRIESGVRKREIGEVDVCKAAHAAIETVRLEAQSHGIAVEIDRPQALTMTADRSEIEIILNNLLSNAVKYNRDGGKVRVGLSCSQQEVTVEVSDTGIGMSEEEAARLFRDFVRIKNERTRNILGSGLGLSIVAKLAQLYGGSASVRSHVDQGSTFTVVLKRHLQDQAHETEPQRDTELAAGKR